MAVNPGLNKVRFPAPVPAGSRLRADVELISLLPGANGALATARVTVEIDGSARPACVAEWLALLVP
jgi:acyl dehydratase